MRWRRYERSGDKILSPFYKVKGGPDRAPAFAQEASAGRPPHTGEVAEGEGACLPSGNAEDRDSQKVILDNSDWIYSLFRSVVGLSQWTPIRN